MSASLLIDLGNTTAQGNTTSIPNGVLVSPSGQLCGLSGVLVGASVDLLNTNTYCNVYITGQAALVSGPLIVGVQCADTDTSGLYTDPTSGLPQLPTAFSSGGVIILNSGSSGGMFAGGPISGQCVMSGFAFSAAFQRPQRYVRATFNSGFFIGPVNVSFISQSKTTGSGGGFTFSPGSGSVNV